MDVMDIINNMDEKLVAEIVKRVLEEQMGKEKTPQLEKQNDRSGVVAIKGSSVKCDVFDTGKQGDRVYLKDILTLEENKNLATGFMEMDSCEFEWTLNYDEVDYIIEGTLEIKIEGRKVTGNAGDVIMIPKGSTIKFAAPGYVKFLYVTYPANWAEQ